MGELEPYDITLRIVFEDLPQEWEHIEAAINEQIETVRNMLLLQCMEYRKLNDTVD